MTLPGRLTPGATPAILVAQGGAQTALQHQKDLAMTDQPPDRMLRLSTVLDRTGLSRATLYRRIQTGTFPRQVKIATRCVGWRESAINAWLRNPIFYHVDDTAGDRS